MINQTDTPPSILELLDAQAPAPRQIALHVTVSGPQGERAYWMSEGGTVFFRRVNGELCRANEAQAKAIMRGLDLARRSPSYTVQGRVAEAIELDAARGLAH